MDTTLHSLIPAIANSALEAVADTTVNFRREDFTGDWTAQIVTHKNAVINVWLSADEGVIVGGVGRLAGDLPTACATLARMVRDG